MKFKRLSRVTKQRARQAWIDDQGHDYPYDDWWTFDNFERIAELLGVTFDRRGKEPAIYFSGFWSQGDGASFAGRYDCVPDASKLIRDYAPLDPVLHALADRLTALQMRVKMEHGAMLQCSIGTSNSHYSHSGCMSTSDTQLDSYEDGDYANTQQNQEDDLELQSIMRAFADWMYRQLEDQYNWYFSDEYVDEQIMNEDLNFNQDGSLR